MEQALIALARQSATVPACGERLGVLAFDSERRRMSSVHARGTELLLLMKGAPESVLDCCALGPGERARLDLVHAALAERGERVLAFAARTIDHAQPTRADERAMKLLGFIALEDPPRAEVPAAISACRAAGVRVVMVTGDHPLTARGIAREIGLVADEEPRIVTGAELARWSAIELQLALDGSAIHFARVDPGQKRRIVHALRRKGHVVAVTGDGVNDAPALREADIGIAMGCEGTDVAREAADLVLLDDNFASIVAAIEEGRVVFVNLRKFLTYILTSNVPEILPYAAFVLLLIPLPLTIVQILLVDLGTDMLPALALGAEPPRADIMRRPPRPRRERLVTTALLLRAYLWLGLWQAAGALFVYANVLQAGGWRYGEALASDEPLYLEATTACLVTIVVMQMGNLFLCRDPRTSPWFGGFARNRLLLLGLASELALILAVVHLPALQALFGTTALPSWVWWQAVGCGCAMVLAEEARKAWLRHREKEGPAQGGAEGLG